MGSEIVFTYQDYSREKSNVKFNTVQMTAANFDAQITAINALSTAILALQPENSLQTKRVVAQNNYLTRAPASDQATQRENKWLCTFQDDTLKTLFRHEIPQAKLSLLGSNSDMLDLSAGAGLAFKTAAEAVVVSPAGNASVLISVQFVGKRL